jgi:hypothetical protein
MPAHTTNFIVNGADYFAAHLDNGGVRVGHVGGYCFDFPAGHALHARAVALTTEADAEIMVDECMSIYA